MGTQDRTGPGATQRSTTGDHCRGRVVIPPTLLRKAGLPPPVETIVRCCGGRYSHFILTVLATTAEPVQKCMIPSKLPRFRYDNEWEAAWDEQLVTLCLPTHCALLQLLQDRLAASWPAYDVASSCCETSLEELFPCVGNSDHGVMEQRLQVRHLGWSSKVQVHPALLQLVNQPVVYVGPKKATSTHYQ
ncbi:hypothetical protein MRX96_015455 [Rhipicephalus microplus]